MFRHAFPPEFAPREAGANRSRRGTRNYCRACWVTTHTYLVQGEVRGTGRLKTCWVTNGVACVRRGVWRQAAGTGSPTPPSPVQFPSCPVANGKQRRLSLSWESSFGERGLGAVASKLEQSATQTPNQRAAVGQRSMCHSGVIVLHLVRKASNLGCCCDLSCQGYCCDLSCLAQILLSHLRAPPGGDMLNSSQGWLRKR